MSRLKWSTFVSCLTFPLNLRNVLLPGPGIVAVVSEINVQIGWCWAVRLATLLHTSFGYNYGYLVAVAARCPVMGESHRVFGLRVLVSLLFRELSSIMCPLQITLTSKARSTMEAPTPKTTMKLPTANKNKCPRADTASSSHPQPKRAKAKNSKPRMGKMTMGQCKQTKGPMCVVLPQWKRITLKRGLQISFTRTISLTS